MSRSRRLLILLVVGGLIAVIQNRLTADPGGTYDPATGRVTGGAR